jgi:hypothetical protein
MIWNVLSVLLSLSIVPIVPTPPGVRSLFLFV